MTDIPQPHITSVFGNLKNPDIWISSPDMLNAQDDVERFSARRLVDSWLANIPSTQHLLKTLFSFCDHLFFRTFNSSSLDWSRDSREYVGSCRSSSVSMSARPSTYKEKHIVKTKKDTSDKLNYLILKGFTYMSIYSSPYFQGQSEHRKFSNARPIYFISWFALVSWL